MIDVKKPTLIINEKTVRRNIRRMKEKAINSKVILRPHFKTHHSSDVGRWFREEGIEQIAVSSVSMAHYFAQYGWEDITIAFPYNPLEIDAINDLKKKTMLHLLIESQESLDHLDKHIEGSIDFFIKIDVGSHRTGLEQKDLDLIKKLSNGTSRVKCRGLLSHAGHTYSCRSHEEIVEAYEDSSGILKEINSALEKDNFFLSFGDTPSCSAVEIFEGIDEIRPGNFVYYDLMQYQITSCELSDIAVALACPVVALHTERSEIVVYGGAVHLSKDSIEAGGKRTFGQPVRFTKDGWEVLEGCRVDRVSQEHGILKYEGESPGFKPGDLVGILPVHSCLTADMMSGQKTLEGKAITKMPKI